jgi:hypothetical protein
VLLHDEFGIHQTRQDRSLIPSSALVIFETQSSASKSMKPSVVAKASAPKGIQSSSRSTCGAEAIQSKKSFQIFLAIV